MKEKKDCLEDIYISIKKKCKYHYLCEKPENKKSIEVCFFNSFLITKDKQTIYLFPYDYILDFNIENHLIYIKLIWKTLVINQDKINSKFASYLSELKNSYQTIKYNLEEYNDIMKDANTIMDNCVICANNNIDYNTLLSYYQLTRVKISTFIVWSIVCIAITLCIVSIAYLLTNFKMNLYTDPLIIITTILTTCFVYKTYINSLIKMRLSKSSNFKSYFFEDQILLKLNIGFIKLDFRDIFFTCKKKNIFYIKLKKMIVPLIIDCSELSDKNIDYLNTLIKKR